MWSVTRPRIRQAEDASSLTGGGGLLSIDTYIAFIGAMSPEEGGKGGTHNTTYLYFKAFVNYIFIYSACTHTYSYIQTVVLVYFKMSVLPHVLAICVKRTFLKFPWKS